MLINAIKRAIIKLRDCDGCKQRRNYLRELYERIANVKKRDEYYEDDGVSLGLVEVKRLTEKACLVHFVNTNDPDLWIPLSQIHEDSEVAGESGARGILFVTAWFAEKEGLGE